jgi:hypothetical protein
MTPIEKLLKKTYILKKKGINDKLKNVHDLYIESLHIINYTIIQYKNSRKHYVNMELNIKRQMEDIICIKYHLNISTH